MPRRFIRLLVLCVAALAATFASAFSNATPEPRRDDCCEQTAHQSEQSAECVRCATGQCCMLPANALFLPDSPAIIGRVPWAVSSGKVRTDPPPLPPPRSSDRPQLFSKSRN